MLKREKTHLLPALAIALENNHCPITYVVLSMRLCGLGGDRACRAALDDLTRLGLIEISRQNGDGDGREKVVMVTIAGKSALTSYHHFLGELVSSSASSSAMMNQTVELQESSAATMS
jgi:hypothetical protein